MNLKFDIVTFATLTHAMKARKYLGKAGLKSKLIKLDSTKTVMGCTYGLEFNSKDVYDVISILRRNGIDYNHVIGGADGDIS